MFPILVYLAALFGVVVAVVQIAKRRTAELRPLIVGAMALVLLLGLAGSVVGLARMLEASAQSAPAAVWSVMGAVLASFNSLSATSWSLLAVSILGGLAITVRASSVPKAGG